MQLINNRKELKSFLASLDKMSTHGLIPTMGALHSGHISLVERSLSENDLTVVSIFVNPTQFNNPDDLAKYPKTLDRDMKLLESISEDLVIFAPSAEEIYAGDISSKTYNFEGLDQVMEGEFRAGHFDGVGTIVEKLLTLIQPTRAYFGEKDFQQLQIIRKLVQLAQLPVTIVGCPIVREANGLAMSSRNERLSPTLREEAAFIYTVLKGAKALFSTKSVAFVTAWVEEQFMGQENLKLEYIKIADEQDLLPVTEKKEGVPYRAFIAVYVNDIRLIDNLAL